MALHNDEVHVIKTSDATPTLPDPTTVSGRVHDLTNTTAAAVAWASTGTNPFMVDGTAVATLSVPSGASLRVRSDGSKWVLIRPLGNRPSWAGTAVTNASGDAVFTFPAGLFASAPVVAATFAAADSQNPIDFRVTAVSATSCTVRLRQSPIVVVLSLSVVGASAPVAGVTVNLIATPAGAAS